MPDVTCSVCGNVIVAAEVAVNVPASASGSGETRPVCAACAEKLQSNRSGESINRTTLIRPLGELRANGKVIVSASGEETAEGDAIITPVIKRKSNAGGSTVPGKDSKRTDVSSEADMLAARRIFGSYEILGEVSRGSFGVVYRAKQQGLDRIVALKVLLAGVHASEEAVARFQREAKAVAKLKHPNIVPIYDIGMQDGHHYFAMEFIEGASLSTLIAEKKLTTPDALRIAEDLADAICTAHQGGVIHRDIKPSNILIDSTGRPHITDFGLAKQVDLDTKYTLSGTTLGTPAYMPPEQAKGEIDRIDERSDVYAIGAVLYEMLTGQTPFAGRSVLEVVVAVISEPVRMPRHINPKIHRDVQTIVLKCLEKDKRQRYDSAAELRDDVRRFRNGEQIRAKPAGLLRRTGRFVARQAVLLAMMFIVLFAVSFSWYRARLFQQQTEQVSRTKDNLVKEIIKKMAPEATWRPDWWFPAQLPPAMVGPEEKDLFKIPDGMEGFRGLVHENYNVPDWRDGKQVVTAAADILVSPEDNRFFIDTDIKAELELDSVTAERGLRVGLQSISKEHRGVPFIAEFLPTAIRIIGPQDIYSHTQSDGQKTPLKLEVKAEKAGTALVEGKYLLNIHREGTLLRFELAGPQPWLNFRIEVKDFNLSSWVFKNTQFVVRHPPPGLKFTSFVARRKYGAEEEPAFAHFRVGEYYDAEAELRVLISGENNLKRAQAFHELGLIQEICQPRSGKEFEHYRKALEALRKAREEQQERVRKFEKDGSKLDKTEANLTLKEIETTDKEIERLQKELHLRRALRFAKNRQWNAFMDELKNGWKDKIGEPLAWELQPVLEMALSEPDDKLLGMQAALTIFMKMDLKPGSTRIGKAAQELGMLFAKFAEYDNLLTLNGVYRTPMLAPAFIDAISLAAKSGKLEDALRLIPPAGPLCNQPGEMRSLILGASEAAAAAVKARKHELAGRVFSALPQPPVLQTICMEVDRLHKDWNSEDFDAFVAMLLPTLVTHAQQDEPMRKVIGTTADRVARTMVLSGRIRDLMTMHDTLRAGADSDPRMAGAFAQAINDVASAVDPGSEALGLELLRFCHARVNKADNEVRGAAVSLARGKAYVDESRRYATVITIQRAYPSPGLLEMARNVMNDLLQRKRYDEAIEFYGKARGAFLDGGQALTPKLIAALENISATEQRNLKSTLVWEVVFTDIEQADKAAARAWRLEYADVELALGRWDKATAIYNLLYNQRESDPIIVARAGLRLAALNVIRPGPVQNAELVDTLLKTENMPDELKLAARLISRPELSAEELLNQFKTINAPQLLTPLEWDFLKAVRGKIEGNLNAAAVEELIRKSAAGRTWINSLSTQLLRPSGSEKPDPKPEPKPPEKKPEPAPKP